jgi:Secretion system C-terminal sorting domain/PA domain
MKQFLWKCFLFGMGLLAGSKMDAQAPAPTRTDTVLLAVFNTSSKFRLKHAGFGLRTPASAELLTQMVLAHDTVMTNTLIGVDSLGRQRRKWVTTYQCGKISKNVKDNVALVSLRACDPTLICLNAQRAGAKAVIFIHTANHRDSLQVPTGAFVDSIRIPCYVIRRDIGRVLSALLPSAVGIKRPDTMPEDAQARRTLNGLSNVPQATLNELAANDTENSTHNELIPNPLRKSVRTQIKISPNPVSETIYVDYQFEQGIDAKVVAKNALGHLIYTASLGEQSGTLNISVQHWANGIYFFEVVQDKRILKTIKIAVQH